MVRNYKPKQKVSYTDEDLNRAVRLVKEDHYSLNNASQLTGVLRETIRWCKDEAALPCRRGSGRITPVLTQDEEEYIVIALEAQTREEKKEIKKPTKKTTMKATKNNEQLQQVTTTDDGDHTQCITCGIEWSVYARGSNEVWVICDNCDEYVCPQCVPTETNLDVDFFCNLCAQHDTYIG